MHLMRTTEVSLGSNKQKYILQLIQALQNVHLILLGVLNQFYASFSALQGAGWLTMQMKLMRPCYELSSAVKPESQWDRGGADSL